MYYGVGNKIVGYCKLFTFWSSSSKPLCTLKSNFMRMFIGWSSAKFIIFCSDGKPRWLLLQKQEWHVYCPAILMIFFFYVAYAIFILKYAKKFTSIWLLLFSIYYSSVKMWPTLKFWTFLLHAILIVFYFMCSWNRFVLALYDFGD